MILVDAEMPKRGCRNCPANYNIDYCKIKYKSVGKEFIEEIFPSWCPIKAEIPDNATNGDVIKALFPGITIKYIGFSAVVITTDDSGMEQEFSREWWDAPYNRKEN